MNYKFLHATWLCKDHLTTYAKDYQAQFMLGYCSTYIFMQTFMIPGTIFMSLLAGVPFGIVRCYYFLQRIGF